MGVNKTVSKAKLDAALANGTIKENDITFVKDTENYEGIVVGNGNNPLRFHTVPSPTSQDTEKILQVDNNGIPKWNTIEEKSTFDGSKTITENLNLGGSLNVTGAVTAQSMTLGSSPTTSSNNMQVPTTNWVYSHFVNNSLVPVIDLLKPSISSSKTCNLAYVVVKQMNVTIGSFVPFHECKEILMFGSGAGDGCSLRIMGISDINILNNDGSATIRIVNVTKYSWYVRVLLYRANYDGYIILGADGCTPQIELPVAKSLAVQSGEAEDVSQTEERLQEEETLQTY